jgi:hypothetical protein
LSSLCGVECLRERLRKYIIHYQFFQDGSG